MKTQSDHKQLLSTWHYTLWKCYEGVKHLVLYNSHHQYVIRAWVRIYSAFLSLYTSILWLTTSVTFSRWIFLKTLQSHPANGQLHHSTLRSTVIIAHLLLSEVVMGINVFRESKSPPWSQNYTVNRPVGRGRAKGAWAPSSWGQRLKTKQMISIRDYDFNRRRAEHTSHTDAGMLYV